VTIEVESKLVVVGSEGGGLLDELGGVRDLGGYALTPREPVRIRDRYLDRADGFLRAARVALRVRESRGKDGKADVRVTMKGMVTSPGDDGGHALGRVEVEHAWSREGFAAILDVLPDDPTGERVDALAAYRDDDPLATWRAMGIHVIQDRETVRDRRDVRATPSGDPVAELCLDTVTFRFGEHAVIHREVEVEALDADDPAHRRAVEAVTGALLDRHPSRLRSWRPSKLETGAALEAWAADGTLARHAPPRGPAALGSDPAVSGGDPAVSGSDPAVSGDERPIVLGPDDYDALLEVCLSRSGGSR